MSTVLSPLRSDKLTSLTSLQFVACLTVSIFEPYYEENESSPVYGTFHSPHLSPFSRQLADSR
ncbi:MAG: hypothetical protein RMK18_01105 [Armatimonadota bacterium]|nr:hypothetical protein [Armatimonadota bacterium]MCX7776861.1 hypothetical protein [Armatimonadota bacterium]MDW8024453.1 hypothetical protein [Armatimonadota bacterium]